MPLVNFRSTRARKSCLEPFRRAEKIERFDVARILRRRACDNCLAVRIHLRNSSACAAI